MNKGIIFDFDGVIIDSLEIQKKAFNESYKVVVNDGNTPSFEEFLSHSGDSLSNILKKMNLPLAMVDYYQKICRSHIHLIKAYDGILELIHKLKKQGYKCGLCTGKDRLRTLEILEKLDLLEVFDSVVCSDDVQKPKPYADSLLLAINNIGVNQENAIMIGDAANDIICAKNAGITNVAVTWGATQREVLEHESPDYIVNTIDELFQVLMESPINEDRKRNKNIFELFEDQVEKTPNNIALELGGKKLTYKDLNEKSNQLARKLRARHINSESLVGIMLKHSFEMVIGIMAVLKAGGAYVPIDSEYPKERINYILSDTKIKLLLTMSGTMISEQYNGETIYLDDSALFEGDTSNLLCKNTSSDLAYVIYTSGSTGKPKGVMVTHYGLANYIKWANKVYVNGETLNFPLYSSISFDLTVTSIYTPLISGNSIVIYSQVLDPFLLRKIFSEGKVGIIKLTPTHMKLLEIFDFTETKIRKMIVGGEDLRTDLAKNIFEKFNKNMEIFNEYGPTETVVGCMIHKYDWQADVRNSVPIGIPADNVRIYLLDNELMSVSKGETGEIYIAGSGVARGYLNQPQITQERFLSDPYDTTARMYKSGDLARMLKDGKMEYVGRIDNQMKIKGFRIEPREIEVKLLMYPYIKEVVVIAKENADNNKFLCAYYVSCQEISIPELRQFLSDRLPDYMVPSYFIPILSIPINQNGKLDTKVLPEPSEVIIDNKASINKHVKATLKVVSGANNSKSEAKNIANKYLVNDFVVAEEYCNMNCSYCLTNISDFKEKHKNAEKRTKYILNYKKNEKLRSKINNVSDVITTNFNVAILKISGGEILMVKEILEYIKIQAKNYKVVQLLTNGLLLNEQMLQELKKIDNICIQLSIDHHTPEGNAYRTKDKRLLSNILNNIDAIVKYGIPLEINCVLTDKNTMIINEFANYLLKYKNNKVMLFPFPVRGVNRDFFYPKAEQFIGIEKLIENYDKYKDIMAPKVYLEYLYNFLKIGQRDIRCVIPALTIGTFDDGTVTPCPNYWFSTLGNLLEENMVDTVKKIGSDKIYRLLLNTNNKIKECRKCFTPWETLNLYFAGILSMDELCASPLYSFEGVREYLTDLCSKLDETH